MMDHLMGAVALVGLVNIAVWPPLIYWRITQITDRVAYLQASVDAMDDLLSGDPPDDPGDGEDEPAEPSNVIAIGRRAA